MAKKVLVMGCGFYGTKVIKLLAAGEVFSDIVIGELDDEKARKAAALVAGSGKKISTVHVDASDTDSLVKAAKGCDLIVNITGPFHLTGVPSIRAAMKLGINYLDINANANALGLEMAIDGEVRAAGISASYASATSRESPTSWLATAPTSLTRSTNCTSAAAAGVIVSRWSE